MECGHQLSAPPEKKAIDYADPQSYTPKHLAEKILITRSSIEGERKLVTVLFADVANYTGMAEKLDPEEVHGIMDGCFKILMDEIHKYEGTINQFTGDGVMAIFGAPVAHEDHAQRACHAALSIHKGIGRYGQKIKLDTGMDFRLRIGLNSGPVIVASIGDDLRMDYTAVGDTTNLAARMESEARPGSTRVSRHTHKIAGDFFDFEPIGKIAVKGKAEPQEIFELIKAGEVETRIEASVARGLTRFVGRNNSMAALKEPYDRVLSGSGQVVGIVGEAGVGKSRLLLEFIDQLPHGEYTYLEGRCIQYGGSIIYLPILDIVKTYLDIKDEDREFIISKKIKDRISGLDPALGRVIPPVQELLSLKVEDEAYLKLEPKQKREKTFEALRDLFIRESQNKPLIVAVEDLHWIDNTSEEFLDYLIGWLANARVMLILLYRPEYTHRWGSKSFYTKIGLTQLGIPSSSELILAILEEGSVAPQLKQFILNRAAGNPLFMEEFTHSLLENGSIQKQNRQYVLNTNASDIQVPDTIQGIIAARMDRLEDNLKRTMQVASVIGREFAFRILQTITGMREEIKSYLLNLQGLEFIYEKSLFPELEYIFKHALTQEVAYNSLLIRRRKEIHEKIGKAIEQIYAKRLDEFYEMLAYHYSKSDDLQKAYKYLKLSGEKATRNHSITEAYRFFGDAIALLDQLDETQKIKTKEIEVRILMGTPMRFLGYPEGSLEILQEGVRLAEELGDEKSIARLYGLIGIYHSLKGNSLLALEFQENSLKEAEKAKDIELLAPLGTSLCLSYLVSGKYLKVAVTAPKLLCLLEKAEKHLEFFGSGFSIYTILQAHYGLALGGLGDFKAGSHAFDKSQRFASKINHLYTKAVMEVDYGGFYAFMGHGRNTIRHAQSSIKYSEQAGAVPVLGHAWGELGIGHYLLGEFQAAIEFIEKGIKIQTDSGLLYLVSWLYAWLSQVYEALCELGEARKCITEAFKLSEKNNEYHWNAFTRILHGRIIVNVDPTRLDKAESEILQGIKILNELKIRSLSSQGYLFLGELYADAGRHESAVDNLKKAESMFQEMKMDFWLAKSYAVFANLHKRKGDIAKAQENLIKSIDILGEIGAEGWVEKYKKAFSEL
jgi:class 3 adenylate cyclase/tetratricopeptide (TPR) repeat protein